MESGRSSLMVTTRLTGNLADRAESAAARLFQGNEAMMVREALIIYLDLRDSLGFDFDREIQPLRERELAAAS